MPRLLGSFVFLATLVLTAVRAGNGIFVEDLDKLREDFGMDAYSKKDFKKPVKIAVLDNGFAGLNPDDPASGGDLPKGTKLVANYPGVAGKPLDPAIEHGARTSRIIYAVAQPQRNVQMRLFNANGQTHFAAAMKEAVAWDAQIIYCGFTIPTLGNFGGDGPVDEAITEAVESGRIFISPAGNYGGMVYNGPISFRELKSGDSNKKFVEFKDTAGKAISALRFKNNVDENDVTVTASWRFKGEGTDQDLDLWLVLEAGDGEPQTVIARAEKKQVLTPDDSPNTSVLAMEQIQHRLKAWRNRNYSLWLVYNGGEFSARDRIRVSIESGKSDRDNKETGKIVEAIEFIDATKDGEIMVVADSRGIAVGDFSSHSSKGPTRDGRSKPDIILEKNAIRFSDLNSFAGNTISSAIFAGIATTLKGAEPKLQQKHLLALRQSVPEKFLAKEGWQVGTLGGIPYPIAQVLEETFAKASLAQKDCYTDFPKVGSLQSLTALSGFRALPVNVQNDPKKYAYYLYVQEYPQPKKQIKDRDTEQWVPGRVEVIAREVPGYYQNVTKYRSQRALIGYHWGVASNGLLTLYADYVTQEVPYTDREWVPAIPAKTRYIPGFYRTIPGQWRWVDQAPKRVVEITSVDRNGTMPWVAARRSSSEYVELQHIALNRADGKGLVVDGSDKDPKFWKTPTPEDLRATVKED